MKRYLTYITAVIITVIVTVAVFNIRRNYIYTNRDRVTVLCYQTNITGSDGEAWAAELRKAFPEVCDFEVSCYTLERSGNEQITVTSSDGWQDIVVRLSAKQGDILLLNNQSFYEYMLENGFLLPLDGFENCITDKDGTPYGIDVTGIKPQGLINLETSHYVGADQPLPLHSLDQNSFEYDETEYEPRVIAAIYKGSLHSEEAVSVLHSLFGEEK